jgi:hypothetical protein
MVPSYTYDECYLYVREDKDVLGSAQCSLSEQPSHTSVELPLQPAKVAWAVSNVDVPVEGPVERVRIAMIAAPLRRSKRVAAQGCLARHSARLAGKPRVNYKH